MDRVRGMLWELVVQDLYVEPESVAFFVKLLDEQTQWYKMAAQAVPHVTRSLTAAHQVKDVGPIVKATVAVQEWLTTYLPQVSFSV